MPDYNYIALFMNKAGQIFSGRHTAVCRPKKMQDNAKNFAKSGFADYSGFHHE